MFEPCYFSVLPSRVRYDKSLCPNEKIFFSEISSLWNSNGYCFAKNEYFAKLYDVNKNTISRWISHLKEKGYIKVFYTYKEKTKAIAKRMILPGEKAFMPVVDESIIFEDTINLEEDNLIENLEESSIENFEKVTEPKKTEEAQNSEENIDEIFEPTPTQKSGYPLHKKVKDNNIKYNNNTERYIYKIFVQKLQKPITPIIKNLLDEWLRIYKNDLLEHAIDIAIENKVPKISYVIGILRNWKKAGVKCLEDVVKTKIEIPEIDQEFLEGLDAILDCNWLEEEEVI